MRFLKNRSIGFYLGFFLILTLVLGGSAIAVFADGGTTQATLSTGGAASEATNFSASVSKQLTGYNQTASYQFTTTVTDPSGSGNGWNLQISGTSLQCSTSPCTNQTLTQQVSSVSTVCATGSTCANATPSTDSHKINYPVVIGSQAPFFSAAANSGLGAMTVTTNIDVIIPGNAYAGTYNSTITISIATGP